MRITLMRYNKSRRSFPPETASSGSRFVAAMIRASTSLDFTPPTRVTCLSWRKRRSLACNSIFSSLISSRNRVDRSARSAAPVLSCAAPVKEPFMCPNISLSMSSEGSAAQFTVTSSRSARGLRRCNSAATSSLPVPVSPVTSTLQLLDAIFVMIS